MWKALISTYRLVSLRRETLWSDVNWWRRNRWPPRVRSRCAESKRSEIKRWLCDTLLPRLILHSSASCPRASPKEYFGLAAKQAYLPAVTICRYMRRIGTTTLINSLQPLALRCPLFSNHIPEIAKSARRYFLATQKPKDFLHVRNTFPCHR